MKRVLLLLTFVLAVQVAPALAQDTPSLSSLEISLWPEFDKPEVLVIYQGSLDPGTPLPVPVEFRIPARVGQPSAVAYSGDGSLLNQEYVTRQEGEWLVVAFELAALEFQLEYYDDQLSVASGATRAFSYSYQVDYPVAKLTLKAQVPPDAQEFGLQPPADMVEAGDYGLDYHIVEAGAVEPGQELTWSLSYSKAGSLLTSEILFPEPTLTPQLQEPTSAPPVLAGSRDNSTALIFVVGFVVVLAVGAAAFWLGQRTQPLPELPAHRPAKRRGSGRGLPAAGPRVPGSAQGEGVYCVRCGTELRPDSEFCHRCGTPARR